MYTLSNQLPPLVFLAYPMKNTNLTKTCGIAATLFLYILLHGCGSITIKPDGGTATIREVDADLLDGTSYVQLPTVSHADTSVISIIEVDGDSTALVCCNLWMEQQWRSTFVRKYGESRGLLWYTDSTVNVISSYYAYSRDYTVPDTLCVDGRRFDKITGEFVGYRELARLADWKHERRFSCRSSADSSWLLLSFYTDYEDAGDDREVWQTQLVLVPANMAEVQKADVDIVVSEDYADDYRPALDVGNNGNIFYTFTREKADTLVQQSLVRLNIAQHRADTLAVSFPKVASYGWTLSLSEPARPLLQALSGDSVLLISPQFNGKVLRFIGVSKFDFGTKSSLFNSTIVFDDTLCLSLVDHYKLDRFVVQSCVALPSGETMLVLQQTRKETNKLNIEYRLTGPIVVINLEKNGSVKWKSSIIREKATCGAYEDYISCHTTDSSFCLIYRDNDSEDGVVFSEFMLADGRSRRRELPVKFSGFNILPYKTLWLNDTLVMYGFATYYTRACVQMIPSGKYTWFDQENSRRIVGDKKVSE